MTPHELGELATKVLPAVQEAGAVAYAHFCRPEFGVETKADGSPVTRADRETEERLRSRLAFLGDAFGFIGEEFGQERADRDLVWVIDPIDGTRAFTRGLPQWALLLALLQHGQPVMGFLFAPALDVLACAWKGGGSVRQRSSRAGFHRGIAESVARQRGIAGNDRAPALGEATRWR